ncbi:transmembrane protein 229B isoform 2-T5 [Pluvialis apricaria]
MCRLQPHPYYGRVSLPHFTSRRRRRPQGTHGPRFRDVQIPAALRAGSKALIKRQQGKACWVFGLKRNLRHPPCKSCQSREGCLVGVLAVGHTHLVRKRLTSETARTCWRQPGRPADAVNQELTKKRESSRIPPQERVPAGVCAEEWLRQNL